MVERLSCAHMKHLDNRADDRVGPDSLNLHLFYCEVSGTRLVCVCRCECHHPVFSYEFGSRSNQSLTISAVTKGSENANTSTL